MAHSVSQDNHLEDASQADESRRALTRPRHRQVQPHTGSRLAKFGIRPMPSRPAGTGKHDGGVGLLGTQYVDTGNYVRVWGGER